MKIRTFSLGFLVASLCVLFVSKPVLADTVSFAGGGFLSGSFVYDASTNSFVSWDITVTAGPASGGNQQFSGITYSNTIAGSLAGPGGFNGAGFYDFNFYSPNGGNSNPGSPNGRTLFFTVPGVADSSISGLPTLPQQMTQIPLITIDSSLAASASCLGLGNTGSAPCGAEGQAVGTRYLQGPAFLNVIDPPAADTIFTMTFTNVPGGTTPPPPPVPEPSTVILMSAGVGVLLILKSRS